MEKVASYMFLVFTTVTCINNDRRFTYSLGHQKNMSPKTPLLYSENRVYRVTAVLPIFLLFAPNIDCGNLQI